MAVNPLKIFLFLLGVSVAGGATAFVSGALDPYIYDQTASAVVDAPDPVPADPAAPKDERLPGAEEEIAPPTMAATPPPADAANPPADAATPPADTAAAPPADAATPPADAAATPPAAEPAAPTFDVVRVEGDGSVVIAGKAFANALVELLNGETVLGSTKATPEGDFAIVLDEPLKPGEYQITLRATPDGGTAVASLETAVLSIPDSPAGQVLAMVEQPGQATELLEVPQPEQPATPKTDEAATPPVEEKPADAAATPADTPPAAEAPKVEETAPKTDEAAVPPAQDEKPADVAAAPAGEAVTPPAGGEKPADVAAAPAVEMPPADAPKLDDAAAPPAQEDKPAEVAAAPADTPPPAETTPAPAEAKVAVEAVEIEGNKIFVAGVGDPGRFVRVYANEIVLGETMVSQGGRFLIETVRDLPVGDYIIRADLLGADGNVLARATVPFEREPGEMIAAVAPEIQQPAEAGAQNEQAPPADTKPATPIVAAEEAPPVDAAPQPEQPAVLAEQTPPPAETPAPQPEQPAVAADQTPPAETPAPQPEQPAVAEDQTPPAETPAPKPAPPVVVAEEAPPAEAPVPEQPAVAGDQIPPKEAPAPEPEQPAVAADETPPATDPVQPATGVAAAEPEQPAAPAETAPEVAAAPAAPETDIAAAPPETVSPKLQKVQGSVIIRRGDTLWRISRRVYGRGIRYWTIYLANQNQTADPDRIWPGQVFTVPDKSKEGEPADMSAMGGQMTTTTTTE